MTLQLHDMRHLLITLGLAFLSNRSPERDRTEVTGLFVMTAEADVSARPPHRFQSAPK